MNSPPSWTRGWPGRNPANAARTPGSRSPVPGEIPSTSHELTHRQSTELAALIADTGPGTAPGSLGAELSRFAGPVTAATARIIVDQPGAVVDVAFSDRAAGHLRELLEYGLTQRETARRFIAAQSPLRAGQRIRVPGAGDSGTIAYITVSWRHDASEPGHLWFHVRLDHAEAEHPVAFPLSALTPLP